MLGRLTLALVATLLVAAGAAAAPKLTPANSISIKGAVSSTEAFMGIDCNATATVTKTLPAGATGITVIEPKVGDRDKPRAGGLAGGTQVTAVSVAGTVVTITVLADGPAICDPALTGYAPGQPVNWSAIYDVRVDYSRRVQSTIRVYYESYLFGAAWQMRPTIIFDSRRSAPRSARARATGIRWTQFGGQKAIGFGTWRLDYCRRGDNCPDNGKRVRLMASKPGYCRDSNRIEYLQLNWYLGKRLQVGQTITCD